MIVAVALLVEHNERLLAIRRAFVVEVVYELAWDCIHEVVLAPVLKRQRGDRGKLRGDEVQVWDLENLALLLRLITNI